MNCDKKWNIDPKDIRADQKKIDMFHRKQRDAKSMMDQRTLLHKYFGIVSHGQSLHTTHLEKTFSEGTTQAIKRKIRSETIQRVPDGEIVTQFDKNSIEHIETKFIFDNKIMRSEYDGKDMLKNLYRTFDESYDYGFGCVRTSFEQDVDGDIRIAYDLIQWNDVLPAPDCDFIEEAPWYIIREYLSYADLWLLLDDEGNCSDSSYDERVIQYILENELKDGMDPRSAPVADVKNYTFKNHSVEVWTLYKRGEDEFETFCPSAEAVLRVVKNEDPRKDVPLHFLILEPDPDFPLGCSSIMWTLGQQQFADAFQTVAYETLLLSTQPPIQIFGNLTNPKLSMKPRAIWPMGTNPNNKIEKFPVETTTLTQYGSILQNVSANMMKNLNATESTIATDADVMTYSGTPQGVEQQKRDKTVTVNSFQKRLEIFFSEWAEHALRSYLNSMGGKQWLTVDEETRRRIFDIEAANAEKDPLTGEPIIENSIIDGDKIEIDFDKLSADMLEYKVRTGSLIESEKEVELRHIQEVLVPISQMIGAVSDQNKPVFEQSIMHLLQRLFELSDIDVSQQMGDAMNSQFLMQAMQVTMNQVAQQRQMIQQLAQQMGAMMPEQGMGQPMGGEMPMEQPMPEHGMPMEAGMPMEQGMPMPPEQGMPMEQPIPEEGQLPPI